MQIKELELENFKSFKHQKFVFNNGITAITGPNGSGKSNVFDALIFVLGNNSSNKLRYKKISDLICRDQKEKYATVRLTFTDGTSIERTVTEEASIFRLNGKRTTQEAIVSFLKELKISSDGHNLVQQGNNKKIIDMTEQERKKLLEDIAGVSLFDEQREKSEKNLDFVKQKISQARAILDERKTMLDTLEKEKTVAEEYLKVKELELILKGVLLKREKISQENEIIRNQKRIETLQKGIPEEKERVLNIIDEIKALHNDLDNKKKSYRKELEEFSKLDAQYKIFEYKKQSLLQELNLAKDHFDNKSHKFKDLTQLVSKETKADLYKEEKELFDLKQQLDKYDLKTLEKEQAKAEKELSLLDLSIQNKYSELYELRSKIQDQESKNKEHQSILANLKDIEQKIQTLRKSSLSTKQLEEELSKTESKIDSLRSVIDDANREQIKLQEKIMQSDYKIDSNKKEIELLKNAKNVSTDLIAIEKQNDADKIIAEHLQKNIYGTFFFVLCNDFDNVKSKVIIKSVSPNDKIDKLNNENKSLENKINELNNEMQENKEKIFELNKDLKNTINEQSSLTRQIDEVKQKNKQNDAQLLFLEEKQNDLKKKADAFGVDVIEYSTDDLEDEISKLQLKKSQINKVNFDDYLKISSDYNKKLESVQKMRLEIKDNELKEQLMQKEKQQLEKEIDELQKIMSEKHNALNKVQEELLSFEQVKSKAENTLRDKDSDVQNCESKIHIDEQLKNDSQTKIKLYENELEELKTNLFLKEESLTKKIEEIKKYIELNTNISMEKLEIEFNNYHGVGIKELQTKYYDALTQLNTFGNVNLKAIEDYDEYLEKYNTIFERIENLEKEMQEIKDKIKEIQAEKEQKFIVCFDGINKNFTETLTKLGLGDLSLNIEKNDLDEISGVTIRSKKRGTISLSGGEKALVTISFLFGVLLLEPSAFYLLDEIDADLDYNNSEKVFGMLNEFAKGTQMLMVTHNPVIVNKADNVIGVSKNSHGVTTIFVKQTQNNTESVTQV